MQPFKTILPRLGTLSLAVPETPGIYCSPRLGLLWKLLNDRFILHALSPNLSKADTPFGAWLCSQGLAHGGHTVNRCWW